MKPYKTFEKIEKVIHHIKRGKAASPDEIPAEAINADVDISIEMLHDMIGKIWDKEEIPTGRKERYLVKLSNKGDLQELHSDNAPVSARKDPQQSHLGQIENSSGRQTQRPPGRLP